MINTLQKLVLGIGILLIGQLVLAEDTALTEETTLKIGDTAPDFILPGSDGKSHSLADYRGKQAIAIAFFPKAFTSG